MITKPKTSNDGFFVHQSDSIIPRYRRIKIQQNYQNRLFFWFFVLFCFSIFCCCCCLFSGCLILIRSLLNIKYLGGKQNTLIYFQCNCQMVLLYILYVFLVTKIGLFILRIMFLNNWWSICRAD